MIVADPYPATHPLYLVPSVRVDFLEVELRTASLNLDDPQPPGYAYRLPFSKEYDSWAEDRGLVVPVEAYSPWGGDIGPLLVTPTQQGVSYYNQGLWHHVGGSVYSWCGDPLTKEGKRVLRGGCRYESVARVRAPHLERGDPIYSNINLGYRLVRGPLP